MNPVGEVVRHLREKRGLTGAQLAAKAGMAPSAISQIETGKRSPNSASVIKLAEALEVEVSEIYPKKAQAPLPLDSVEQRSGAPLVRIMAAYETAYNSYEALGERLVEQWRTALEKWDEKLPPGEKELGSADLVQGLLDWVLQMGELITEYTVRGEVGFPNRPGLRNIVRQMEEVHSATAKKLTRIFEQMKTNVEFREIVKRMMDIELNVH